MGAKWRAVLCIVGFLTSSSFLTIYSASISDPRIVGGDPVNGNSRYPFMVALYQLIGGAKQFRCGGTLIGSNIVLCAAHCFDYVDYVEVGRYDRLDSNEEGVRGFSIIEKVVHPLYEGDSDTSADHDVMVIQIDGDASDLPKVTLDTNDGQVSLEPGTDLIVMGWGHTSYEGSTSQGNYYLILELLFSHVSDVLLKSYKRSNSILLNKTFVHKIMIVLSLSLTI